jgi:diguanylate cyclase (GGDEF)-like protein/PAS domain S-box-containing protein
MVRAVPISAAARRDDGGEAAPGEASADAAIGDVLAGWPGPAALLDREGRLLRANPGAMALLAALLRQPEEFAALVTGSAAPGFQVTLPGEPAAQTFEITRLLVRDRVLLLGRDLSLANRVRAALVDSRQRYKDIVEVSSDFAWETDSRGAFVFVSPKGALGFAAAELLGREAASLLLDDPAAPADLAASPFVAGHPVIAQEFWLRRADGSPARMVISAAPIAAPGEPFAGARGICRDISESFAQEAELIEARNHERLMDRVTRTIRDEVEPGAMLETAAATLARAVGADGLEIWRGRPGSFRIAAKFGASAPADLDGETLLARLEPGTETFVASASVAGNGLAVGTSCRRTPNGAVTLWRAADRAGWTDADSALIVGVANQLGVALAQVEQHEALVEVARTDFLTGLLNRRTFATELGLRLRHAQRTGRSGALLYIDLDNFKQVNDQQGHQRGDAVLKLIAAPLREDKRAADLGARLGGDEFALWLEDTNEAGALAKARSLLTIGRAMNDLAGEPDRPLGLSIGIAVHLPIRPETEEALIARADAAMYEAKRSGKDRVTVAPPVAP